jgi:hypothetical protein
VPDITGQPAWVVIVIMFLTVSATLGVAFLTTRRKSVNQEEGEQATLPSGETSPTVLVMHAALDHLARVADREAAESEEARKEAAALRTRLEEQLHEVVRLQSLITETREALTRCQARAEFLSEQAFRRGEHD